MALLEMVLVLSKADLLGMGLLDSSRGTSTADSETGTDLVDTLQPVSQGSVGSSWMSVLFMLILLDVVGRMKQL